MYDDLIKESKKEYNCISCNEPIKIGQHCPICNIDKIAKAKTAEAYKKFLEAAKKTTSPMED